MQHLVRELICGWRLVVDEYMKTSEPLSGIVLSDPGNNNEEFNTSQESKKPPEPKQVIEKRQEQPVTGGSDHTKETQRPQIKKHGTITKTVKAVNEESGSRRPIMPNGLQKLDNEAKILTKSDMSAEQRKPNPSTEKPEVADEDAYKLKLEATKRKLHENYHKAETAKRQRMIQIFKYPAGEQMQIDAWFVFFDMVQGLPASPSSSDRKFISR